MLRATGSGSLVRRRWSGRSRPKQPKPPSRTNPVRLAATLVVAGLVLANMILAYRLLGEAHSPVAVVLGRAEQIGEGSPAFEQLGEALDRLSRTEIGVAIPISGGMSEARGSYTAQNLSTPVAVSKSAAAGSDTSSGSDGSDSSGSGSDDENSGTDDEGSDDDSEGDDEGDDGKGSDDDDDDDDDGDGDGDDSTS